MLAYAAAVTSRITLGTGIVILPLRNPVILAKELATIDVLSQGRLVVGIGVGYVPGEYEAIGVPFDTRGRRADEWIDALRTLWRDDQPELRGEFASFGGIQCRPRPDRSPAARRSSAAGWRPRRAVAAVDRCDGWYGFYLDLDNTKAAIDELDRLAQRGRPPGRARASSRSPSRRCPARSTPTPCAATRTSASTGSCSCRTSATWRVDPTPARRGKFLDEMAACAERLDIR